MTYLGNREAPLEELLEDPIVQLVMARDNVSASDMLRCLDTARARLRTRRNTCHGADRRTVARSAAAHALADRLTAINFYLAAALRACKTDPANPELRDILGKAATEAAGATAILHGRQTSVVDTSIAVAARPELRSGVTPVRH